MIEKYVSGIASQMEIKLSGVVLTDGASLGCVDAILLSLTAGNKLVSEFIHKKEIEGANSGSYSQMLEFKIKAALTRLKISLTSL